MYNEISNYSNSEVKLAFNYCNSNIQFFARYLNTPLIIFVASSITEKPNANNNTVSQIKKKTEKTFDKHFKMSVLKSHLYLDILQR
jgi:hypothetical protein